MRQRALRLAFGCGITLGLACGQSSPPGEAPIEPSAGPQRAAAAVALADVRALPAKGRFLVTPRWSPDGDRLLLSGWHGIGLHAFDLATGAVRDLDLQHRGAACWDATGKVAPEQPLVEDGWWVLHERDGLRVLYRPRDGAIEARASGTMVTLVEAGAWGARVSPDGARVAFCTGHLPTGRLRIAEVSGALLFEGAGVHPAWLPDRAGLIYAVPEPALSRAGEIEVGSSELYFVGAPSWAPVRLTDTPDVVEMEPAISPRGDRIAFSDWKSGTLLLARLAGAGGAR